jgi:hypothetical protein
MIYHVTWVDDSHNVHDYYFSTKGESVEFIKTLHKGLDGLEFTVDDIDHVMLKKIDTPKTQRGWAHALTNLVSLSLGVYQGSNWFGRVVYEQKWIHHEGRWYGGRG